MGQEVKTVSFAGEDVELRPLTDSEVEQVVRQQLHIGRPKAIAHRVANALQEYSQMGLVVVRRAGGLTPSFGIVDLEERAAFSPGDVALAIETVTYLPV